MVIIELIELIERVSQLEKEVEILKSEQYNDDFTKIHL